MKSEKKSLIEDKLFHLKNIIENQKDTIQNSTRQSLISYEQMRIHDELIAEIFIILSELDKLPLEENFVKCELIERRYFIEKKYVKY